MSGKENKCPLKYKNIEELKPHYDRLQLTGKNPRDLMQKLDLIFKKAGEKMANGDLEDAYILIMKYLSVFSFIQKSDDFKNDSKYYKVMLGKQPKEAMEFAETLHSTLSASYNLLNHVGNEKNKKERPSLNNIIMNIEMPDMRVKKESKSVVTSAKLFTMLRDGITKVLIMDTRPKSDFESSRIKDSIVNIPGDIIIKGISANMLEQQLSDSSKDLWKLRGTYDQVVLLDWMTCEQNFNGSKLALLKEILTEWDVNTNYKNEILILDGGYEDWLDKYPWSTTNPKPFRPCMEETVSDIILDQVIYPDLDDLNASVQQEFLKPFFDRSKKPLKRSLNDLDQDGNEETTQFDQSERPAFDRAKKAAAIKTYEERKADVANLLSQKAKETSEALVLEKTMLENEKKLQETIKKQTEIQADEEQRRVLEEKEEKLLMRVEELKEESILKDSKIKELQKIIEIYEKRDIEELARKEKDEERKIREGELNERIKLQEAEKMRLAKEREEIEKAKLLERKILEEKYREKLEIARSKKKRLSESSSLNPAKNCTSIDANSSQIPIINRGTKPRFDEKIRQFNGVKGNVGRGLTGLKNLGNSCYMNSILQCISNNPALAKYFCGNHYREDLHKRNKTKGEVAEEVAAVIKTLWSGHFRSIACKDFKNTVGNYKSEYATFEQQDSHEFLTFLMDWLHSDLNKMITPNQLENEYGNEVEKAWLDFKQKNESLISTLFYGLQKSTVTCMKCDETSVTYEPFSNLSLIIPDSEYSSAEQCLRLYLKSEHISGWRCPKCKELRDAEKKTDICKLPPILIIHLKRFHYIEVLSRKRTSYVDFPLNDLNMSQYVVSLKQRHLNYDLYAISNHYGTMEGGHYTAYCKSPLYKKWYKFDDHEVYEISPSEVKTSAAYILFYTSINCQVPEPTS